MIEEALELLKNPKLSENKKISFLIEQLSLVFRKPVQRRYSSSLLAMAVMWQKFSPTTYKHIFDGVLTLHTERRIRQLTSAITVDLELGESTKTYLKARRAKLKPKDCLVNVIIDEVYIAKQVQYVNGKFYGIEESNITKTLLCIMIKAVAGKYRDVIGLVPCSILDAKKQHELWIKILPTLCQIGSEPIITMTDGNHKFYKGTCDGTLKTWVSLSFPPQFPQHDQIGIQRMYQTFDSVHLFKCFYNNFLSRELFICPSFVGETMLQASFGHIKQLYDLELGMPLKMAYKLCDKVLHPATIEQTNVSLADACFHESTIHALRYYSSNGFPEFSGTAEVLQIFRNWFNSH